MVRLLSTLDVIDVASPCPADWDGMSGDARVRHCDQCDLKVYNLSEMSEAQALDLVQKTEGRLCVRFFRRPDGTILTKDCPVGIAAIRRRLVRLWAGAVALGGTLLLNVIFGRSSVAGEKTPFPIKPAVPPRLTEVKGDVCIPGAPIDLKALPKEGVLKLLRAGLEQERAAAQGMPDPDNPPALTEVERQKIEALLKDPQWKFPAAGSKPHSDLVEQMRKLTAKYPELGLSPPVEVQLEIIRPAVMGKVIARPIPLEKAIDDTKR